MAKKKKDNTPGTAQEAHDATVKEKKPRESRAERRKTRPYLTERELLTAMKAYFDEVSATSDWKDIAAGFAALKEKAEEKGSWDGLEKEYQKLLDMAEGGQFTDEAGMRIALRLSHETYLGYKEDPEFRRAFDWAMDMRESWLARRLAAEPKMAQAYLNALKQPANGGWVDRRTDTGDKTLGVKIIGVGGEDAFK